MGGGGKKTTLPGKKTTPPSKKTILGVVKKRHYGGKKTIPEEEPMKKNLYEEYDVSGDGGSAAPERASPTANLENKEIKVRGPRNSSTTLTKEGIRNTASLKQHNWQDDEIDYAMEIMANHKEPISNWLSFAVAVIKNLRNDKRKEEYQGEKTCKKKNNRIKLPPEEPGIRTHEGASMDSGTLSSLIASRPNHFLEFCSPKTSNGS